MSATYQQVDIEGHTDITAHLDGLQCLQHTDKLASSLTETWRPVSATYLQVDIKRQTDIIAHLDGAQCLQHTNKLISKVTQTLQRT